MPARRGALEDRRARGRAGRARRASRRGRGPARRGRCWPCRRRPAGTSRRGSRFSRVSILPSILAPPRIAANGRSGSPSRRDERLDLAHQEPAGGLARRGARARRRSRRGRGGRCRRRRRRRPRRARRARAANSGSFFSSPAWKRRFSSSTTPPSPSSPRRRRAPARRRSRRRSATGRAEQLGELRRHRPQACTSGRASPFGRPQCEASSRRAPAAESSRIVGSASSSRVSSTTVAVRQRHVEVDAHEHRHAAQAGRGRGLRASAVGTLNESNLKGEGTRPPLGRRTKSERPHPSAVARSRSLRSC